MKQVKVGKTGLYISEIVFGGNVFGWTVDKVQAFKLLDEMLDMGLTTIDTADMYSSWVPGNQGGESEAIIGEWLKSRNARGQIQILTKCGWPELGSKKNLSSEKIVLAVEKSLARLQTDYIDLYQAHFDDSETPLDEMLQAFERLRKDGKVRYVGGSNYTGDRLREVIGEAERRAIPGFQCFQTQYNVYDREVYETTIKPVVEESGIGVLTYFSLASGFLSGKYKSANDLKIENKRYDFLKGYANARGFKIIKSLEIVKNGRDAEIADIALAWIKSKKEITAPIASVTTLSQLKRLQSACDIKLTKGELDIIDAASFF